MRDRLNSDSNSMSAVSLWIGVVRPVSVLEGFEFDAASRLEEDVRGYRHEAFGMFELGCGAG